MAGYLHPAPGKNFYLVYTIKGGYAVHDPHGIRVSDGQPKKAAADAICAELQAAADAKSKRGVRPCMCCSKSFESDGVHNRLCLNCRHGSNVLDPVRPYIGRRA